jgi:hypothetical protein
MTFRCAIDLGKAPKKLVGGPVPDVEEAFEVDCFFLISLDLSLTHSSSLISLMKW